MVGVHALAGWKMILGYYPRSRKPFANGEI